MSDDDYDVERKSISDLFSGRKYYVIPDYQRSYAWDGDNAEQLFEDMREISGSDVNASNTSALLGVMVVVKRPDDSQFEVVDGQQRLATLSLMFCAIRSYLYSFVNTKSNTVSEVINDAIKELDDLLVYGQDKVRVTLGESDAKLFKEIVSNRDPNYESFCKRLREDYQSNKRRITESHDLLIKNYRKLCKDIRKWMRQLGLDETSSEDELVKPIQSISRNVRKITGRSHFAYVKVNNRSIAYKIFNTFNSRGQPLLQKDLIKNHLLDLIDSDEELQKRTKTDWNKIFDERLENSDTFLYESLSSRHPSGRVGSFPISKNNLYRIIDSIVKTPSDVGRYVKEVAEDAKIIKQMDYPEDLDDGQRYDKIKSDLHGIKLLNARYIRVPILAAWRKWKVESRAFQELTDCLLIFFFKFKFINDGTTEDVRAIANNVTKMVENGRNVSEIIYHILTNEDVRDKPKLRIDNDEFEANFRDKMYKPSTSAVRYILSSLEIYLRKRANKEHIYPRYSFELEHILPKNHERHWNTTEFLNAGSSDIISKYKNRLGNLTLLSQRWNRNLGAKGFGTKKKSGTGYAKSDFLINKKYLKNYTEWTATNLEDREEKLCQLANGAWSLKEYDKYLDKK